MNPINRDRDIPPNRPVGVASPGSATDPKTQSNVSTSEADQPRTSGATKEAAASKVAEQKLAGQAQEVRLRSAPTIMVNGQPVASENEVKDDERDQGLYQRYQESSGTVFVNGKDAFRKDDKSEKCKEPTNRK